MEGLNNVVYENKGQKSSSGNNTDNNNNTEGTQI